MRITRRIIHTTNRLFFLNNGAGEGTWGWTNSEDGRAIGGSLDGDDAVADGLAPAPDDNGGGAPAESDEMGAVSTRDVLTASSSLIS